jgi:hypothetical protein
MSNLQLKLTWMSRFSLRRKSVFSGLYFKSKCNIDNLGTASIVENDQLFCLSSTICSFFWQATFDESFERNFSVVFELKKTENQGNVCFFRLNKVYRCQRNIGLNREGCGSMINFEKSFFKICNILFACKLKLLNG